MSSACASETVTIRELLKQLGQGDHAFLTLMIALCFMHPIPMPGISWGLSLIIIAAGTRLMRGQGLWVPPSLIDRPMRSQILGRVFGAAASGLRRVERLIQPRGRWLTSHRFSAQANGAAMILCGLLILVPLPPPTNFPPASALLLISLGMLETDGLLLGLGYLAAAATTAGFTILGVVGWTGVKALLG